MTKGSPIFISIIIARWNSLVVRYSMEPSPLKCIAIANGHMQTAIYIMTALKRNHVVAMHTDNYSKRQIEYKVTTYSI